MCNNATEIHPLFLQSLGYEIQLVQVNLILHDYGGTWTIDCGLNSVPIELLIVSIRCWTEVLRHLPTQQLSKVQKSVLHLLVITIIWTNFMHEVSTTKFLVENSLAFISDLFSACKLDQISLDLTYGCCPCLITILCFEIRLVKIIKFLILLLVQQLIFLLHLLELLNVIVLSLTQLNALHCKSVFDFLFNLSIQSWSQDNQALLVYGKLCSIDDIGLVIDEPQVLRPVPLDHQEAFLL
jgi:hypothetical protein